MVMTSGLLAVAAAAPVSADETRGIAVTGNGEARAKPTIVELSATVRGEAELAGDAITKYNGNKRRALDAIADLQIEGLTVEDGGVSINSADGGNAMMAAMRGMPAPENTTQKLSLSEPLVLRLSSIEGLSTEELLETLVRIVDAGKDAGLKIGPPAKSMYEMQIAAQSGQTMESALAAFKLENIDQLKQQAYEAAFADARDQAQRLADLAGVRLGGVISIHEGEPASESSSRNNPYYYYAYLNSNNNSEKEYVTNGLREIPVKVVLQVEFAIE
jgi:uncharacterized protein YggE